MADRIKTLAENGEEEVVAIVEGTFVGRVTGGNLGSLTPEQAAALVARLPRGHIDGLRPFSATSSSATVLAGACRSDDDTMDLVLASGLEKLLTSSWSAGHTAGGLDTGSSAADSCYHLWVIGRSDTGAVDALFSLSATAPTLPTNYDKKRRVGAVLTDGTGAIRAFQSIGEGRELTLQLAEPARSFADQSHGGANTTRTLTVPTGISVLAHVRLQTEINSEHMIGLAGVTLPAASGTQWDNTTGVDSFDTTRDWRWLITDGAGQITTRSDTGGGISMFVLGWREYR